MWSPTWCHNGEIKTSPLFHQSTSLETPQSLLFQFALELHAHTANKNGHTSAVLNFPTCKSHLFDNQKERQRYTCHTYPSQQRLLWVLLKISCKDAGANTWYQRKRIEEGGWSAKEGDRYSESRSKWAVRGKKWTDGKIWMRKCKVGGVQCCQRDGQCGGDAGQWKKTEGCWNIHGLVSWWRRWSNSCLPVITLCRVPAHASCQSTSESVYSAKCRSSCCHSLSSRRFLNSDSLPYLSASLRLELAHSLACCFVFFKPTHSQTHLLFY